MAADEALAAIASSDEMRARVTELPAEATKEECHKLDGQAEKQIQTEWHEGFVQSKPRDELKREAGDGHVETQVQAADQCSRETEEGLLLDLCEEKRKKEVNHEVALVGGLGQREENMAGNRTTNTKEEREEIVTKGEDKDIQTERQLKMGSDDDDDGEEQEVDRRRRRRRSSSRERRSRRDRSRSRERQRTKKRDRREGKRRSRSRSRSREKKRRRTRSKSPDRKEKRRSSRDYRKEEDERRRRRSRESARSRSRSRESKPTKERMADVTSGTFNSSFGPSLDFFALSSHYLS